MVNVYDFDGTILDGDTEYYFFNYALTNIKELNEEEKDTIKELLELPHSLFFDCSIHFYWLLNKLDNLDCIINDFWDKHQCYIKKFYYETKQDSDIISSATPTFLIKPIMDRLGIKNYFGTELNDDLTLKKHNKGIHKVKSLFNKFPNIKINNFYSDSDNDLPLARLSINPYKVDGNNIIPWDTSINSNNLKEDEYRVYLEMKGNTFKILNLTDIQLHRGDYNETSVASDAFKLIDKLVEMTKPDLITLTGDQVYNGDLICLIPLCEHINSYNIPWAPIFGNHDNLVYVLYKGRPNRTQGYIYSKYSNCIYRQGPKCLAYYSNNTDRFGNYIISLTKGDRIIRNLIMLNSGDTDEYSEEELNNNKGSLANDSKYASLSDEQVNMIHTYSFDTPSTLFIHIPLYAYAKAINEALDMPYDYFSNRKEYVEYINKLDVLPFIDKSIDPTSKGVFKDTLIACPPIEDNVIERLLDTKLDSCIAGHDHSSNFIVDYKGISLVYATKTGRGCYYNPVVQGGTLIEIKEDSKPAISHILVKD